MVTLLGISGCLRKGSLNSALLKAAAGLPAEGYTLQTAGIHGIPLYDGDLEEAEGIPPAVTALKEKIIALAQRHRRYGAGMIYLKLRQAGELVNHKRVDRLYAEADLQVKKRRRKKILIADRHPLERPTEINQV